VTVSGFRFRAQAALDLREREDAEAQRALARAEAGLQAAIARLREAEQRGQEARTQCAALVQQSGSGAQQQWYRSWIIALDRERAVAAAAVTARQTERARAAAARVATHQRVEALERFKEKARLAWQQKLAAEEQKHLDSLATIRFVSAARIRANG
jgi:flagellar export protein FliJ